MERVITWKSPKIVAALFFSLVVLLGLLILAQGVNAPVVFADPNLEQVIREKIEKPHNPIYRNDLASVMELDASSRDIHRLEGIEVLRRLVVLNLADNAIEDLRPLSQLRMLKELDLSNNQIIDLAEVHFDQITHLHLRELNLQDNQNADGDALSDMTYLGDLHDLEVLTLRHNQITDLSPLANLSKLHELDLRGNLIGDLEPLRDLTQLAVLNLRDNTVTDLEPLAGLKKLVHLNIHSNPVQSGVQVLGNFKQLETLIMRNVYIGDAYAFLENLTQLRRLNIRNTGITDVSVVGQLMEVGALQDNPETGVMAYIDLLQVDPTGNSDDPYRSLRRYWDNISTRYPLSLPYFPSTVNPPLFSHQSGFYEEEFYLTLTTDEPGARIVYTTDGSEPALTPDLQPMGSTKEYYEPILIHKRENSENLLLNIQTSPQKNLPNKDTSKVFLASIIRAFVVEVDSTRSYIVSHTFFIDENVQRRYTMPIVSIAINSDYLFDPEIGIYVPGDMYENIYPDALWWNPANYTQRGLKWERPIFFQLFSHNGDVLVSQNLGVRVHGGATRSLAQKSLRLYAKPEYDQITSINYDFFPTITNRLTDLSVDSFQTIILRNSGNDWESNNRWRSTMFRDAMSQSLLEHTNLDIQGYLPVIVFINGEYWGIHNFRTRYDEHYFNSYYGIEIEDLIVLEGGFGSLYIGDQDDPSSYQNLLKLIDEDYINNNFRTTFALSDHELFEYFSTWMDIENFITYNIAQIYLNNTDWGGSNIRFWRKKTDPFVTNDLATYGHDGKWRWMVIDTDFGFFNPKNNTLTYSTRNASSSSFLFRSFLENDKFKEKFINTFADHLNTTFHEEVVINKINEFEALYFPEAQEQIYRWGNMGGSLDAWLENVQLMREFALLRPTYQRQQIIEFFNLPGYSEITILTDPSKGYVQINSLELQEGSIGVIDPSNWSGIYFHGIPINITAFPYDGFRFEGWMGIEDLTLDSTNPQLYLILEKDLRMTALFSEVQ